jgi:membrane-bound ClpP family serine protease
MTLETADILTIINATRSSGGIPLQVNVLATTEWTQYLILMLITLISAFFVIVLMWDGYIKPIIGNLYVKYILRKFKNITGRNTILIKHTESGLFSQSMIDLTTLHKLERAFQSFKGKPFDLILHTPGGYVFYTQLLSKAIKSYGAEVRAFVPFYAMSGGTILALSCDQLFMGAFACLGPVDPQLGGLFSYGSAKSWKEVLRKKGRKANDASIQFAYVGEQYTKTIRTDMTKLLESKISDPIQLETATNILTDGQLEHAYQLDITKLNDLGIPTKLMDRILQELLVKIICNNWIEGVAWC